MQSYEERISQRHLLQPFRRASDKCVHEPSVVLPDLRFGKVFRHIHHRLYYFAANLLAGMIAYNLMPKKPSLNIEIIDKSRLVA